jgi:hypothetical protein
VLQKLSKHIADALAQAAAAEQRAREATDPQLRSDNELLAGSWRALAHRFQSAEGLEQFQIESKKNRARRSREHASRHATPPSLFRCPITGWGACGFLVEEIPSEDPNAFEPVVCAACGQIHLLNFKTRKTVGNERAD